ncbi:LysM peptidoglycan-binding domain-containing protein [Methylocaldum szegediense]|uniref:Membrane-bound lytic murein transglycosylase D n=1 Tax=Methylocaldum szegediense TaxID=73780 RepID=A0ABM9I1L9_9GAMM|nr:LysM peptidoglycan-binding domain-containing protein [Methylocaldum szegediense]CAI8829857.1 membrane-bound lytic murein transglycosylase D [Methylocaldum szegediense]
MRRPKRDVKLLCYASVFALSLSACTHHAGKPKNDNSLTDNLQPASTAASKKSRVFHISKSTSRWFKKKNKSAAGGSRTGGKKLAEYDSLWDRLFDSYSLPPVEHEDIDRELEWFINHPGYVDRVQKRAEPFLYSIVKQFEKHNVPGELALLPVIESAFQPDAVSPAKAAGLWQFIPSTGRIYGLKQSRSYDGRRDVYASTRAAIKYLKKLHSDFNGDWLLAIAAYNCGEGAVARAIQKNEARNKPTDFWSLDLPEETRVYVPRLLAVAKLFAEAEQYGIDLHHIPNEALFKPVKIDTKVDLALAADAADISLDKLYELNPGFKHRYADVEGSYRLFIPADKKISEFKQELERLAQQSQSPNQGRPSIADELIAARDSKVTGTYSRRVDENRKLLKGKSSNSAEKGGGRRRVAVAASKPNGKVVSANGKIVSKIRSENSVALASASRKPAASLGKQSTYTVQAGDTLWSIAKKNSVDVEQLAKWNGLSVKNGVVKAGQTLVLWNKDAGKKLAIASSGIKPSQSIRYTVQQGDTLFSISKRFKVSVADLRKWNGSKVEKHIQPGTSIMVQVERD